MPGELAAGIARLVSLLPPEGRRDLRRLLAHELAAPAPELERGARLDLLCDLIEWAGGEVPTVENYEDERSRRGGLAPPSAATLSSLRRLDQRGGRRRLARGGRIRWTAGERAPRVPASIFTRGGPTHPGVLPRRARLVADTVGVRGVGTTPAPSPAALSRGSRKVLLASRCSRDSSVASRQPLPQPATSHVESAEFPRSCFHAKREYPGSRPTPCREVLLAAQSFLRQRKEVACRARWPVGTAARTSRAPPRRTSCSPSSGRSSSRRRALPASLDGCWRGRRRYAAHPQMSDPTAGTDRRHRRPATRAGW